MVIGSSKTNKPGFNKTKRVNETKPFPFDKCFIFKPISSPVTKNPAAIERMSGHLVPSVIAADKQSKTVCCTERGKVLAIITNTCVFQNSETIMRLINK